MSDGIRPSLEVWAPEPTATRACGKRTRYESAERAQAIRALQGDQLVVYAVQQSDGVIKIGCTSNLAQRRSYLDGELLAFRFGDFDAERGVHQTLRSSVAHGDEYYHPTPEVLAVVNEWREAFGLPALGAP